MGYGDTSAKDRKKQAASEQERLGRQKAEDASWEETDKGISKKLNRAKAKEEKADAKLASRAERQALEEAENAEISKLKGANKGSQKITQAELARRQALMAASVPKKTTKTVVVPQPELDENRNRESETVEASGLDDILNSLEDGDHSGAASSSKMTFKQFEENMIDAVKEENPDLKMSQIKARLKKLWDRSEDNPKNQGGA